METAPLLCRRQSHAACAMAGGLASARDHQRHVTGELAGLQVRSRDGNNWQQDCSSRAEFEQAEEWGGVGGGSGRKTCKQHANNTHRCIRDSGAACCTVNSAPRDCSSSSLSEDSEPLSSISLLLRRRPDSRLQGSIRKVISCGMALCTMLAAVSI